MRLGSIRIDEQDRAVAFVGDWVVELNAGHVSKLRAEGASQPSEQAAAELPADMLSIIDRGPAALAAARDVIEQADREGFASAAYVRPLSSVRYTAPHRPRKIVCTGTNYEDYRKLIGIDYAPVPLIFMKSPTCVIGHDETVYLPAGYGIFYHEWEFSCVISKRCRGVRPDEVNDHIFGYTIFNDITGRSLEATNRELQPLGKNMDTFGPFGPWIVTPDDMPDDLYNLRTLRRRNGKIECDSNTSNMRLGFDEIVAYAANFFTLEPGDVVTTATPPAGAFHPGDVIEAEIEGIGVLRNPVEAVEVSTRYAEELELREIV
jgi:2-keto-4-pentenoate hydratase/2-oxohepta-3-ene-1,7-dioic acid hydratase in catechol pathway